VHVSDVGPDGRRRERLSEELVAVLDRCDADLRLVVSADLPYQRDMAGAADATSAANRLVRELVVRAPGRLFGSCMVNPRFPEASRAAIRLCFEEWGFVQLGEMLTYMHGYELDDEASLDAIRAAAAYGVPVHVHLGTYWHRDYRGGVDGMDQMRGLLRAFERVPEATYVLAHAIGCGPSPEYVPWADWYLDVLAAYFGAWPRNVWVEIRDFQAPALARALREVPADRLLAGTDWTTRIGPPFQSYGTMFGVAEAANPFPPTVAAMIGFLRAAGAEDEAVARIGFRNAEELLKLRL
jgi:predicted TIM-barrel fold metal-dependent hydrolase